MKKTYRIIVKLLSPLHINGGVAADSTRITVKTGGKPYIPATLFKGLVRSNFRQLMKTFQPDNDLTDYFFGKEGFQRSRIIFENLETKQELVTELRTNVSVNRYLRCKADSALVNTEVISCFDKENNNVVFEGTISAFYAIEEMAEYDKFLLEAIGMIDNIGLGKSRGLGFVEVNTVVEES